MTDAAMSSEKAAGEETPPTSGTAMSLTDVWAYWLSLGWAALLLSACLALALHWVPLGDALDARRLFR